MINPLGEKTDWPPPFAFWLVNSSTSTQYSHNNNNDNDKSAIAVELQCGSSSSSSIRSVGLDSAQPAVSADHPKHTTCFSSDPLFSSFAWPTVWVSQTHTQNKIKIYSLMLLLRSLTRETCCHYGFLTQTAELQKDQGPAG